MLLLLISTDWVSSWGECYLHTLLYGELVWAPAYISAGDTWTRPSGLPIRMRLCLLSFWDWGLLILLWMPTNDSEMNCLEACFFQVTF